jgi:hypothetical protein
MLVVLPPTASHAASRSLAEAEKAYAALDFDQVMPLLDRAGKEQLSEAEEQRRRELTAVMHAIYERPVLARNGFLQVLAHDASYQLPDGSAPKIRSAFDDAISARSAMGLTAPGPITQRWWFWAAAGAVLVGVIVVGVAASQGSPEHDYGPYALP